MKELVYKKSAEKKVKPNRIKRKKEIDGRNRYEKYYKNVGEAEKIKIKSRRIANKLLRVGKLKPKNCFLCGESFTNMHHIDYDYPDKVIWLCKYHKNKIHLKK